MGIAEDNRLDAMSDDELLIALGDVYSAVLTRLNRHQYDGIDPDYADRKPNKEAQSDALAWVAKVETVMERFMSGKPEDEMPLFGWNAGWDELKRQTRYEATIVALGGDPRPQAVA